jgi:hypothetical protein
VLALEKGYIWQLVDCACRDSFEERSGTAGSHGRSINEQDLARLEMLVADTAGLSFPVGESSCDVGSECKKFGGASRVLFLNRKIHLLIASCM